MVEILWKSKAPHLPAKDHELVELRLVEVDRGAKPRFLIREIHAAWSAANQQIQWRGYLDQTCGSPQEAKSLFESRKASIAEAGFPYTTILA